MHYIDVPVYWPYEKDVTYKGRFKLEYCKLINETLCDPNHYLTFCEEIVKIPRYKNSRVRERDLKIFLAVFGVGQKLTIKQVKERYHLSGECVGHILFGLYSYFLKMNERGIFNEVKGN